MSKTTFKVAVVVLAFAGLLGSCKSEYDALLSSNDVDQKYAAAFYFFNHGKYN